MYVLPLGKTSSPERASPSLSWHSECLGSKGDGGSFSRRLNGRTSSGFQELN